MPAPSGAAFGSLRSRKVDLKKPLPVLRWSDCPDLDESASLNRAIPVVATGVEKEEEDEHHLKVALNANEAGVNKATLFIPTPDASRLISDYDKFYRPTFSITKSLIKFSAHVEDLIGCSYCLDEEDDEFLADYRTKCKERIDDLTPADELSDDLFELLMTGLERVGGEKFQLVNDPVTWEEAVTYMKQNEPFLHYPESAFKMVFTHWQRRRYRRKPGGGPIMPTVKLDEIGPNPESDPYICFRRREIRPVRKSKRPDTGSLDKLRRLRDDLCRVRTLLEYVAEREHAKKEALLLEKMIFEQRVLVRKIKKKLGVSTTERDLELASDARKKKKGDEIRATKIKIPLQKLKEAGGTGDGSEAQASDPHAVLSETAVIEAQVKKRKLQDEKEGWLDLTEDPFCPLLRTGIERRLYIRDLPLHLPLSAPSLPSPPPTVHSSQDSSSAPESFTRAPQRLRFARRRVGRGGRICIDRHIRQADWLHGFGSGAVFVNSVEEEKWMARARRWQFDDSDEEIEDLAIELDESASVLAFRAFHLAPNNDDIYSLMAKPAFPDQINPKPIIDPSSRPILQPPVVTRSGIPSAPPLAQNSHGSTAAPTLTAPSVSHTTPILQQSIPSTPGPSTVASSTNVTTTPGPSSSKKKLKEPKNGTAPTNQTPVAAQTIVASKTKKQQPLTDDRHPPVRPHPQDGLDRQAAERAGLTQQQIMLLQRQQHMRNGQIASTLASAGVSPGTTSGQLPKGPTPAELQQILSGEIPPNYSPQMAEFIKEQYRQRFIQHKLMQQHAALGLANGVMNGAGPSGLSGAAHPSPLSPGVPMANAVPMSPGHLGTAGMGMPNGMNGMLSSPANAIRLLQYQQLQMQAQAAAAAAAASSNPSGGGASVVNLSPSPAPPTVPMSPTTNSSSPAATPPVYIQHMLMNKGVVLNGGNGSSPLQTSSSTQPPSLSQSQLLQQQQPIRAGPGKIALDGTGPSADVIDATSAINGNLARGIS